MAKTLTVVGATGGDASLEVSETAFGSEFNEALVHQVVTAYLSGGRAGTKAQKSRAQVRGGGAKPWRQKGTGRARQGSIRSPQWRGGGVALGPKPRSYAQRTPKMMKRLALRSALSDRAAQERVLVVDEWSFETPRTKDALAALSSLDLEGRILLVLGDDEANAAKSFRNLREVHTVRASELNTYDVLVSDWVVFSKATVPAPEPAAPAPTPEAAVETAEPEQAEEEEAETAVTTDDAVDGDEPESTENETDEEES